MWLLHTLTPREECIIKMHFGLNYEGRSSTIEDIAYCWGMTSTRILEIEQVALRKLKRKGLFLRDVATFGNLSSLMASHNSVI